MKTSIFFLRFFICFSIVTASAWGSGFSDKSSLGITDMAICTAAAMKSGQSFDLYTVWVTALNARYKVIYPDYSEKQRDAYTAERVMDKKAKLNRMGIVTTPAFMKFYSENCEQFIP